MAISINSVIQIPQNLYDFHFFVLYEFISVIDVYSEGGLSSKKSKWLGIGHQPLEIVMMIGNKIDGIKSCLISYRTMREGTVEDLFCLILGTIVDWQNILAGLDDGLRVNSSF